MKGLNLGCGPFYISSGGGVEWVNVDVVRTDSIRPDVLSVVGECLPFPSRTFDRAYLGHFLEHVPWADTVRVLKDVLRVLVSGGVLVVVGPDVERALRDRLAAPSDKGRADVLTACMESDPYFHALDPEVPVEKGGGWHGARHLWNCTGSRVLGAVVRAGFAHAKEVDVEHDRALDGWPITSRVNWQCAVIGVRPLE